MMQQRASINYQLRIWGAPEAWSHVHITNDKVTLIHVQVRRSVVGKCRMIRSDRSSTAYLPITFINKTVWVIVKNLCLRMWHSSLIRGEAGAFAPIWSKFRCTGESWAYLCDRSITAYSPIPFGNQNRLGENEYLCQRMRYRITYLWQSRRFCWHIIEVQVHLWSASQRVGSWDTARVFLAQMPLSLPEFCWPMIEDHSQLRASILSRLSFLGM